MDSKPNSNLKVFCQHCGQKLPANQDANFCFHCGARLSSGSGLNFREAAITPEGTSSRQKKSSPDEQPDKKGISFESFKKRKEAARASKFTSKKGKNNLGEAMVKIQVGLKREKDGELKKVKGQTLPILVKETSSLTDLLSSALDKHSKHFENFNKFEEYYLLYPDESVMCYMPGSLDPFVLNRYKDDLGKPYSKIVFWLCKISDMDKVNGNNVSDASSLSDPEPSGTCGSHFAQDKHHDPTKSTCSDPKPSSSEESTTFKVPCPSCSLKFPLNEIEEHANLCIDETIGTISDGATAVENDDDDDDDDDDDCFITEESEESEVRDKGNHDPQGQLKKCVEDLQRKVNKEKQTRVNIRRRSAFKDYLDLRKRKWFHPEQLFKVTFVGEPAIDDGGPRREFFSEVLKQIKQQLFSNGMLVYSIGSLSNDEFLAVGELFAASIAQGGPAPSFLTEELFDYIAAPDGVKSIVKDPRWAAQVQDPSVKMVIDKLSKCNNDEEFRQVLIEDHVLDVLTSSGYRGIPFKETLQAKEAIIRSLILSDVCKMLPLIDQLIKGLESFGVLDAIRKNGHGLKALFTSCEASKYLPNSEDFLDSLDAEFSENGSNSKEKEINVYKYFTDYIQELSVIEGGLPKLHKFITGMEEIPPLGLPNRVTVRFRHLCAINCNCRPTVSTCDLSITFPVHYLDYKGFQESMNSAIDDCCGFGLL